MSGTSLDGLDLALCSFEPQGHTFSFNILKAETLAYDKVWRTRLTEAKNASAQGYMQLHAQYGAYLASAVKQFLKDAPAQPGAIAAHGHTIFHQPQLGFTSQLGCGATIAAHTGLTTVCDLRSVDVALGGQGAPLVPIGDKLLLGHYKACLNLGGIANISFDKNGQRMAYDIGEANMLLNHLAEKAGKAFDENGDMARSGNIHQELLQVLNHQEYYLQSGARSTGREWFEAQVQPLVDNMKMPVNDLLATATEHIAHIIANELNEQNIESVLVTGGGALNTFLMDRLRFKTNAELIVPDKQLIQFKEALVFAFLGYLRLNKQVNTFKSVTGASKNSVGGAVYLG